MNLRHYFGCAQPRLDGVLFMAPLLLAVAPGCAPQDAGHGHGILVVAVDALRADHVQSAGYDRRTTPFLDGLAAEGVSFGSAWSSGPGIVPAQVALLTGCDPLLARVPPLLKDGPRATPLVGWNIPDEVPRLAVELLANGYTTAAFVDHPLIGSLRGFDQGFVDWVDYGGGWSADAFEFGIRGVGGRFLEWLRERESGEDWFAYVHMNDLERIWKMSVDELPPVFEPRPELGRVPPLGASEPLYYSLPRSRWNGTDRSLGELEAVYDSALLEVDKNLARLFAQMKRRGHWDKTTVVVVGTFGVGFGDSGFIAASGSLSDVDLHVPFIIRPAPGGRFEAGRRIEAPVSLVDLPPTVLALAGIQAPTGMHGVSLVPAMGGSDEPPREFAFASSFISEGYTVIDDQFCYERSRPGSRGPGPLSRSWYGDDVSRRSEYREVLHDRLAGGAIGHLDLGLRDPAIRASMRAAGRQWYSLIGRARVILHRLPWASEAPDPVEVAELRAAGVLGIWP
ncbi:MAG: arylsulfatase A-like enzyme [Chlamydiales bacterium]|jgi:arylsulfatase A-like enzyme